MRDRLAKCGGFLRNTDVQAVLLLAAFPFVYFWQVTLGRGVWFTSDIVSIYHPFGVELGRSLAQGRLPLWAPEILAGFPLLAEGHVSAFYPVYRLLYALWPAHYALSYAMLFHLAWAGVGMYACGRSLGFRPAGALLAGLAFSLNGFTLEKLYHTPILITGSWLPWLIFLQNRFQRARAARRGSSGVWLVLTALAFALELVAGFPQIALLSAIALVYFGILGQLVHPFGHGARPGGVGSPSLRRLASAAFWTVAPTILGIGIAAIQLVPTIELIGFSVRSQNLSSSYLTEYSFPPAFLSQFVLPFAQGEPTEHTNEYWAYFGLAPFVFALLAPILRRDRRTFFTALFALGALVLALGNLNPAYDLIARLPVFSLFRTPARFILLFLFAAVILGATGFEELSNCLARAPISRMAIGIAVIFGALTAGVIGLAWQEPIEFWLQAWQILPIVFALVLVAALFFAWKRRWQAASFGAFVIGLTFVDLACYAPPFLQTLAALTPPSYVESVPRSVPLLQNGRVYTDLSVVPTVPAVRGSLLPNTALVFRKASVQANSPLVYSRHDAFLSNLKPAMLNLLNVRYFLLPLEPRFTDRTSGPAGWLALDVLNNEIAIPSTPSRAVEVASYTEGLGDLEARTPVANLLVRLDDGSVQSYPLRLGIETDEWDFDRAEAIGAIKRDRATVARTFSGFVRSFGRTFAAHTYVGRFALGPETRNVVAVEVHSFVPNGRLTIERISLVDERGEGHSLAASSHKDDFELAYMSDTVAAWENLNVLPRAFIVHDAQVLDDTTTLARMQSPEWHPEQTVFLNGGQALPEAVPLPKAVPLPPAVSEGPWHDDVDFAQDAPERVELTANTDRAGYLVLADSWYPGWKVAVDGRAAPVYRADLIVRAVPLEPGEHRIVFEYEPFSLRLGAIISFLSLVAVLGTAIAVNRIEV